MNELEVVLRYLAKNNSDELYQMYYLHAINTIYEAELCNREIKKPKYITKAFKEYELQVSEIKKSYDYKKFREDYGWAYKTIEKPTFNKIRNSLDGEKLESYYLRACAFLHSDARGTFENIGVLFNNKVFPCGSTNVGLSDPGQLTIISLSKAIYSYNEIFNNEEITLLLCFLPTLQKIFMEAFSNIQGDMESLNGMSNIDEE